jgi:phosphoribosylanthranilate isomerase
VFVKICGITNESDALFAVAMGADAVGFVFAPSPRQIAPVVARDIARRLPPEILTVGVFRDESTQRVVQIVNSMGLRGVQLHGHESPAEARWVRQRVPFVIKAISAGDRNLERAGDYEVDALLLDAAEPGSGRVFDWSLAEHLPVDRRIILAGGLDPDNVAEAIERVRPWGVDVSTGVEAAPGHKDARKVRAFVLAAKAFETDDEGYFDLGHDEPELYDWGEDWVLERQEQPTAAVPADGASGFSAGAEDA